MLRSITRPQVLAPLRGIRKPYSASASAAVADATRSMQPIQSKTETSDKPPVNNAEPYDEKTQGYVHGAFHWTLERASAVALIPLMSTQILYGAHPICDGLLGVVLPFHIHMGFDSCITDYIPKRVYPRMHKVAHWTLFASTGLVMWGCFEFNTNDVGLTEAIQRIWVA